MKTYKIHLIRHGMTKANTEGLYCGVTDLPLCDEGVSELSRLVGEYDYPYVDAVYVSPLLRAKQTADILYPCCDHTEVAKLAESSLGPFEGRAFEELKGDPDFQRFVCPGSDFIPDGVEPPAEFHMRCREALIEIIDGMMSSGVFSAAVITHAGVISNMLAGLAYPKYSPLEWQSSCGRGYTVIADPTIYMRDHVVEVVGEVPEDDGFFDAEEDADV